MSENTTKTLNRGKAVIPARDTTQGDVTITADDGVVSDDSPAIRRDTGGQYPLNSMSPAEGQSIRNQIVDDTLLVREDAPFDYPLNDLDPNIFLEAFDIEDLLNTLLSLSAQPQFLLDSEYGTDPPGTNEPTQRWRDARFADNTDLFDALIEDIDMKAQFTNGPLYIETRTGMRGLDFYRLNSAMESSYSEVFEGGKNRLTVLVCGMVEEAPSSTSTNGLAVVHYVRRQAGQYWLAAGATPDISQFRVGGTVDTSETTPIYFDFGTVVPYQIFAYAVTLDYTTGNATAWVHTNPSSPEDTLDTWWDEPIEDASALDLRVGASITPSNDHWRGMIFHYQLHDYILPSAAIEDFFTEMETLYQTGTSILVDVDVEASIAPGFIGCWDFRYAHVSSDSRGIAIVLPGGPLAHVDDRSGNGYRMWQTTEARFPTWASQGYASFASDNLGTPNNDLATDIATDQQMIYALVRCSDVSASGMILAKHNINSNGSFYLAVTDSKIRYITIRDDSDRVDLDVDPFTRENEWVIICAEYDGDNMSIYVDNALEAGPLARTGDLRLNTTVQVQIGRYAGGAEWWWNGDIARVELYNEAHSSGERTDVYNRLDNIRENLGIAGAFAISGDVLVTDEGSNVYLIEWLSSGDWTVSDPVVVEALCVAGGGGGGLTGNFSAGGGGAGGMLEHSSLFLSGSGEVVVGRGGWGSLGSTVLARQGEDSSIAALTAIGGGRGGNPGSTASRTGGDGGSGGGGGSNSGSGSGGSGTSEQGNDGGGGFEGASGTTSAGGGGGGAGSVGVTATSSTGGDGGDGSASSITGSSVTYAGGGGGNAQTGTIGAGGAGGGGAGGNLSTTPEKGVDGLGGGGGGSPTGAPGLVGSTAPRGGSGTVIIRVTTNDLVVNPRWEPEEPDAWYRSDNDVLFTTSGGSTESTVGDDVGRWEDEVSSDNNLTVYASDYPTYENPHRRSSVEFIGAGSTMLSLDSGDGRDIARNTGAFTIFAVATPMYQTAAHYGVIYNTEVANGTGARAWLYRESNVWKAGGRRLDGNSFQGTTGGSVELGKPTALAAVFDYANANLKLYVDGVLEGENASFQTAGNTSDTASLRVSAGGYASGAALAFPARIFEGGIHEVVAFRRIPTSEELDDFFNHARHWWQT